MNARQLHILFNPRSIEVIGASDTLGRIGYALFRNLVESDFSGPVYPVNPNRERVQGVKAYPRMAALPRKVDLAIIATRAPTVPGMVDECIASRALSAVVISAGFSEAGEAGNRLVDQIRGSVEASGMALLGPNCLG